MARLSDVRKTGKIILLIDDQEEYLASTRAIIEREGHYVICASSGEQGLKIAASVHVDLILVDFFMPGGMTGEQFVIELRKTDALAQVILQTGYSGELPPREILKRLDIQGYHDKTEGPDKLLLWIDLGLKMQLMVSSLDAGKRGLRDILAATRELSRIQPLEELLRGVLLGIAGLMGAKETQGFVALFDDESELRVRAATMGFSERAKPSPDIDPQIMKAIRDALGGDRIAISDRRTLIPLKAGDEALGIVYMDRRIASVDDIELLRIFANQAAVLIRNSQAYDVASGDRQSGVYARSFFDGSFLRELRAAFRARQPLSLLMIDMGGLKAINDGAGRLAADRALRQAGSALRTATRATDIVARYGGEEFAVILPRTPIENIGVVASRIESLVGLEYRIGAVCADIQDFDQDKIPRPFPQDYFEAMSKAMIIGAESTLREAESTDAERGLGCVGIPWPRFE